MKRRTFLINTFLATSFGNTLISCTSFLNKNKSIIDPIEFIKNSKQRGLTELGITYHAEDLSCKKIQEHGICRGRSGKLIIFDDLGNFSQSQIDIPAHSFEQHPLQPNLIWIIPNFDSKSYLFDKSSFKIIDTISFENFYFYGHGLIFPDNTCIATMAHPNDLNRGFIIKFDLKTKKILQSLDLDNVSYHQVIYHEKRKSLIATGRDIYNAYVFEIELENLKLKTSLYYKDSYEFRHLKLLKNGDVFLAGHGAETHPYPLNVSPIGTLNLESKKFNIHSVSKTEANDYSGEMLNFYVDENHGKAFVINPYRGMLYEYNLTNGQVASKRIVPIKGFKKFTNSFTATSLTLNYSSFFVSKDLFDYTIERNIMKTPSGFGSHVYDFKI